MINTFEHDDATVSEKATAKVLNYGAQHYTIGMRGFYLSVTHCPVAVRSGLDVIR